MYEVKVYKIWWEDEPEEFYIGATKEKGLSYRMRNHRCRARKGGSSRIHSTMRRKGFDFKYIQLASCEVSNKDESNSFEQQWINKLKPTLNMQNAHGLDAKGKRKKRGLMDRMEAKELIPEIKCDICGETFTLFCDLNEHKKTHGPRPYSCDQCDKAYTVKDNLVTHKKKHSGRLSYMNIL